MLESLRNNPQASERIGVLTGFSVDYLSTFSGDTERTTSLYFLVNISDTDSTGRIDKLGYSNLMSTDLFQRTLTVCYQRPTNERVPRISSCAIIA